jgi:hypothetical protein
VLYSIGHFFSLEDFLRWLIPLRNQVKYISTMTKFISLENNVIHCHFFQLAKEDQFSNHHPICYLGEFANFHPNGFHTLENRDK